MKNLKGKKLKEYDLSLAYLLNFIASKIFKLLFE